jgi:hypothetical protein
MDEVGRRQGHALDLDHLGDELAVRHQPPGAAQVADVGDGEAAIRQQREAVRQEAVDPAAGDEPAAPVGSQAGDATALVRDEDVAARGRDHTFRPRQLLADELQIRDGDLERHHRAPRSADMVPRTAARFNSPKAVWSDPGCAMIVPDRG